MSAVTTAAREQGIAFPLQLAIYQPLVQALRELRDEPDPRVFPRDPAWTAAIWTEEVARKMGNADASRGWPWMWSVWQLHMKNHPLGQAYEKGYMSIPRSVILGHALEAAGRMIHKQGVHTPLDVAKILRVFSWQDEKLPKVFEQWVLEYAREHNITEEWVPYQSIEALLAGEASGDLYPFLA